MALLLRQPDVRRPTLSAGRCSLSNLTASGASTM
jgi:hypothetical protein